MATKPSSLPEWASDGAADVVEPSLGQKQDGWDVSDRPPAGWQNWWMKLVWNWTQYLDTPVGTGAGAGFTATGGPTNGTGLVGIGVGTGAGVSGTGGDTGPAVKGDKTGQTSGNGGLFTGAGTNSGVSATGGAGGGRGVSGTGVGASAGVQGTGGATGVGLVGIGGATSGAGVTGTGTAGNSRGGDFQGQGSAEGAIGTGGSTSGAIGMRGIGGSSNGVGVKGEGVGTGTGAYGLGVNGYGVQAESDTTTPDKAALRIVPQDADPVTSPASGDTYVNTSTGKPRVYNGTNFNRVITQDKASIANATDVTATSETAFSEKYTIPAGTLVAGSVIRVRAQGVAPAAGGITFNLRLRIGGVGGTEICRFTGIPKDGSDDRAWFMDATISVRSVGASGVIAPVTVLHYAFNDVAVGSGSAVTGFPIMSTPAVKPTIDTTVSRDLVVTVLNSSGSSINRLEQLIVDIT